MKLNELSPAPGSTHSSIRVGRGTGSGKGGAVKVKTTIVDGKITAVEVVEHTETPGFFEPAIEAIPAAIVAAQSAQVDIVAGATATSNAIMTAVAEAMAQAGL